MSDTKKSYKGFLIVVLGAIFALALASIIGKNKKIKSLEEKVHFCKNSFFKLKRGNEKSYANFDEVIEKHIKNLVSLLELAGIIDDNNEAKQATSLSDEIFQSGHIRHSSARNSKANFKWARKPNEYYVEMLEEMKKEIKTDSMSNERIAKIVLNMIDFNNKLDLDNQIDVRNIYFINDEKTKNMVVELYTALYGKESYQDELARLWKEIFLAEDFWKADFDKVRINIRDKQSEELIETISCSIEDVKNYLTKKLDDNQFAACWVRKCS